MVQTISQVSKLQLLSIGYQTVSSTQYWIDALCVAPAGSANELATDASDAQAAAFTTDISSHKHYPQSNVHNQHDPPDVTAVGSGSSQLEEVFAPTQLIQAGVSSLLAADAPPSNPSDAHTATQLAEEVAATQLVNSRSANHAATQAFNPAATPQLTDADAINDPAHRLASAQSTDPNPMSSTACDHVMTEAAHEHVPSNSDAMTQLADKAAVTQLTDEIAAPQLADAAAATQLADEPAATQLADAAAATQLAAEATVTQLADDAAATQLADAAAATQLAETIVRDQPAHANALPKPTGNDTATQQGDAMPMQSNVSNSDAQENSRPNHHSQHQHLTPAPTSEIMEPQAKLQDSRTSGAGQSSQAQPAGNAGFALEDHAMDVDTCELHDIEMEESAEPAAASAVKALSKALSQHVTDSTGKDDLAAREPARTDAEMKPPTQRDHIAGGHSMPDGQLYGRSLEPPKQAQSAASKHGSEVRAEAAADHKAGSAPQSELRKAVSPDM